MQYKAHPAAEIFPLMTGAEFDALVKDIKENGLREPITLHEGEILDGRNRLRACEQLGIKPKFEEWDADGTPQTYVVSKNLHRRHLDASQRAMIAARLANVEVGQVGRGRPALDVGITTSNAAELLNIHRSTVADARKVLREGTEEEIEAVDSGNASVGTVADQIREKISPTKREKKRKEPLSQSGRNPERIQRQQMNADIWRRLGDALSALSGLPLPADVAAIVAGNVARRQHVERYLAQSFQWLKDFEHEWSNRDENAA